MIIADLYVERQNRKREEPKTIVIWRVYAQTDFNVAKLLSNYIPDPRCIEVIIKRVHTEQRVILKNVNNLPDIGTDYENWMVLTDNLAEVNKIYMEVKGLHHFQPSYGMDDALDVSKIVWRDDEPHVF